MTNQMTATFTEEQHSVTDGTVTVTWKTYTLTEGTYTKELTAEAFQQIKTNYFWAGFNIVSYEETETTKTTVYSN